MAETLGAFMLITPVVGALVTWLWVARIDLLRNPGVMLNVVAVVVVLATATLAAIEANKLGIGKARDQAKATLLSKVGPFAWFLFVALLWVVGYPAYLFERSRHGRKNFLVGGVILAVAFTISYTLLLIAIDTQPERIKSLFTN